MTKARITTFEMSLLPRFVFADPPAGITSGVSYHHPTLPMSTHPQLSRALAHAPEFQGMSRDELDSFVNKTAEEKSHAHLFPTGAAANLMSRRVLFWNGDYSHAGKHALFMNEVSRNLGWLADISRGCPRAHDEVMLTFDNWLCTAAQDEEVLSWLDELFTDPTTWSSPREFKALNAEDKRAFEVYFHARSWIDKLILDRNHHAYPILLALVERGNVAARGIFIRLLQTEYHKIDRQIYSWREMLQLRQAVTILDEINPITEYLGLADRLNNLSVRPLFLERHVESRVRYDVRRSELLRRLRHRNASGQPVDRFISTLKKIAYPQRSTMPTEEELESLSRLLHWESKKEVRRAMGYAAERHPKMVDLIGYLTDEADDVYEHIDVSAYEEMIEVDPTYDAFWALHFLGCLENASALRVMEKLNIPWEVPEDPGDLDDERFFIAAFHRLEQAGKSKEIKKLIDYLEDFNHSRVLTHIKSVLDNRPKLKSV